MAIDLDRLRDETLSGLLSVGRIGSAGLMEKAGNAPAATEALARVAATHVIEADPPAAE